MAEESVGRDNLRGVPDKPRERGDLEVRNDAELGPRKVPIRYWPPDRPRVESVDPGESAK